MHGNMNVKCANVVWELICLQVASPWHSRSLCPKAVRIYRHEWWRAAWSRCWGGGTAHVGPGPVIFQRAWVWFRIPTPAHPQNEGRDHLHHCWSSAHCYLETYCCLSCQFPDWWFYWSWEPVMCCSCVRTAVSKVASHSGHRVVINKGIWFLLKPTSLYCDLANSGNFAFQWKFFPIAIL